MIDKTEEEMLETFKNHIDYFIKKFGLFEWRTTVILSDLTSNNRSAQVSCDPNSMDAFIELCKTNKHRSSEEKLKESALHEVLHIMIAQIRYIVSRTLSKNEFNNYYYPLEEALVHRITKMIGYNDLNEL